VTSSDMCNQLAVLHKHANRAVEHADADWRALSPANL
jgi:hypothetical protein